MDEKSSGQSDGDRGEGGGPGKETSFPTVATVPKPQKMRWEQWRVSLVSGIAEGEGTAGEANEWVDTDQGREVQEASVMHGKT